MVPPARKFCLFDTTKTTFKKTRLYKDSSKPRKKLDNLSNINPRKNNGDGGKMQRPQSGTDVREKSNSRGKPEKLHALKSELHKTQDASKSLEAEYIRSLQQQIYLLELENEHIRQQVNEAKVLQQKLPTELAELRAQLEEEKTLSESLRQELTRREQNVATLMRQQLDLSERVRKTEEEKEALAAQLVQATAEKNALAGENVRQTAQIGDLRLELYKHQMALSTTENQVQSLRAQNPTTLREDATVYRETRGPPKESDSREKHLESQFHRQAEDDRQLNDVQEQFLEGSLFDSPLAHAKVASPKRFYKPK
ncbi:unnamed protein product [Dibothriocephalus latus]|uniref:Uncharacterized protein n=1 Tax=Dibothriocephalus latus TaxID=60516 RepID=A0A3P7KY06_DIBLA|nr:unnamed protein product [Dibothriocephalus latus]